MSRWSALSQGPALLPQPSNTNLNVKKTKIQCSGSFKLNAGVKLQRARGQVLMNIKHMVEN